MAPRRSLRRRLARPPSTVIPEPSSGAIGAARDAGLHPPALFCVIPVDLFRRDLPTMTALIAIAHENGMRFDRRQRARFRRQLSRAHHRPLFRGYLDHLFLPGQAARLLRRWRRPGVLFTRTATTWPELIDSLRVARQRGTHRYLLGPPSASTVGLDTAPGGDPDPEVGPVLRR